MIETRTTARRVPHPLTPAGRRLSAPPPAPGGQFPLAGHGPARHWGRYSADVLLPATAPPDTKQATRAGTPQRCAARPYRVAARRCGRRAPASARPEFSNLDERTGVAVSRRCTGKRWSARRHAWAVISAYLAARRAATRRRRWNGAPASVSCREGEKGGYPSVRGSGAPKVSYRFCR
jgi:hypothetical protein